MSKLVAVYCRQSDPNKKAVEGMDNTLSIETQLDETAKLAARQGFAFPTDEDIYKEQITSEIFDERPALSRLVANAHKYQAILVYKYDRIARDPNQLTVFVQLMRAKGIRVLSALEAEPPATPIGDMILYIHGTFAKMVKLAIIENTNKTKRKLMEQGLLIGAGQPLFGYCYDKKKRTRVIVPEQAKIVVRIFNEVADGRSLRQIAETLNLEGVPAPRRAWNAPTLCTMLHDESYIGEPFQTGKRRSTDRRLPSGKRLEVRNPKELHRPVGDGTPIIITDRGLWDRAHVQLSNKTKRPKAKFPMWLRGHVFCHHCGGTMTPTGGGKNPSHSLRCNRTAHYRAWGYEKCVNKPFKLSEVEEVVWAKVIRFAKDRPYMEARINEALGKLARPDYEGQLKLHQSKVKKLKSKLATILDQFGTSTSRAIREASTAQAEKVGKEIEVEESLIEELESTLALSRSKAELLKEVRGVLDKHVDEIENASYEERCKIMDAIGVHVRLGNLTAADRMPDELRKKLDLPENPDEPRTKVIVTEVFRTNPAKSHSVGRKFFR